MNKFVFELSIIYLFSSIATPLPFEEEAKSFLPDDASDYEAVVSRPQWFVSMQECLKSALNVSDRGFSFDHLFDIRHDFMNVNEGIFPGITYQASVAVKKFSRTVKDVSLAVYNDIGPIEKIFEFRSDEWTTFYCKGILIYKLKENVNVSLSWPVTLTDTKFNCFKIYSFVRFEDGHFSSNLRPLCHSRACTQRLDGKKQVKINYSGSNSKGISCNSLTQIFMDENLEEKNSSFIFQKIVVSKHTSSYITIKSPKGTRKITSSNYLEENRARFYSDGLPFAVIVTGKNISFTAIFKSYSTIPACVTKEDGNAKLVSNAIHTTHAGYSTQCTTQINRSTAKLVLITVVDTRKSSVNRRKSTCKDFMKISSDFMIEKKLCIRESEKLLIYGRRVKIILQSRNKLINPVYRLSYKILNYEEDTNDENLSNLYEYNYMLSVPKDFYTKIEFDNLSIGSGNGSIGTQCLLSDNYLALSGSNGSLIHCGYWNIAPTPATIFGQNVIIKAKLSGEDVLFAKFQSDKLLMCDKEWHRFNNYCFTIRNEQLNWFEAEEKCRKFGAYLASVDSLEVQKYIEQLIKRDNKTNIDKVWIGGSDNLNENDFIWSQNGRPFGYTNWFGGWEYGKMKYGAQPSDDGLSNQDCVEIRDNFQYPGKGVGRTDGYYWNDISCQINNSFICQKNLIEDKIQEFDCNSTIEISTKLQNYSNIITLSSPNYPDPYLNAQNCQTNIKIVESANKIFVKFMKLKIENSLNCQYDYLEIGELMSDGTTWFKDKKFCGDWSDKMKLLQFTFINSSGISVRFISDKSHSDQGYSLNITISNESFSNEDSVDNSKYCDAHYNDTTCYKLVDYANGNWTETRTMCQKKYKGQLAIVESESEEKLIIKLIRKHEKLHKNNAEHYWLGGRITDAQWMWINGNRFNYSDWYPAMPESMKISSFSNQCLAISCQSSKDLNERVQYSGLYWTPVSCEKKGPFICQIFKSTVIKEQNETITNETGTLVSPRFQGNYSNGMHHITKLVASNNSSRIELILKKVNIEWQKDCLYDYLLIEDLSSGEVNKYCGNYTNSSRYISDGSELNVVFHSDSSITDKGFELTWKMVDLSSCPVLELNDLEMGGEITSPNYPDHYLPNLNCKFILTSKFSHHRVLIKFIDFDVGNRKKSSRSCISNFVEVQLGESSGSRRICGNKSEDDLSSNLAFLSQQNTLMVTLKTSAQFSTSHGFKAVYSIIDGTLHDTSIIKIGPWNQGFITSLNYPDPSPKDIKQEFRLLAPYGYIIRINFVVTRKNHQIRMTTSSDIDCIGDVVEMEDVYHPKSNSTSQLSGVGKTVTICEVYRNVVKRNERSSDVQYFDNNISLNSTLNSIRIRLKTPASKEANSITFKAFYEAVKTMDFWNKSLKVAAASTKLFVDTCLQDTCLNGGICNEESGGVGRCECKGKYSGLFCHATWCDLSPCGKNGKCNLTDDYYVCSCNKGFDGMKCERNFSPCYGKNPCRNHGDCVVVGYNKYSCNCTAMYIGKHCENKLMYFPYTPLREKMLKDPFWLGLITVMVVLVVILFVWCIKRKFADKIERLIKNEIEKSKATNTSPRYSYNSGLRDSNATSASGSPNIHQVNRPLFIKLRKPSLRSITDSEKSPPIGCVGLSSDDNRSFSFDDIIRRVQSFTRRKSLLNIPDHQSRDKEDLNTAKILQQLVAPKSSGHMSRRMSLDEFIQMNEKKFNIGGNLGDNIESSMESLTSTESGVRSGVGETSFIQGFSPRSRRKHFSFPKYPTIRENSVTESTGHPEDDMLGVDGITMVPVALQEGIPGDMSDQSESVSEGILMTVPIDGHTTSSSQSSPLSLRRNSGPNPNISSSASNSEDKSYNSDPKVEMTLKRSPSESAWKIPNTSAGSFPSFTVHGSPPRIGTPKLANFKFPTMPERDTVPENSKCTCKGIIVPPKILITSNISSCESDGAFSPPLTPRGIINDQRKSPVMAYLSPITTMCQGGSRTISESNLSSSGYSSMASPAPSRCGSRTPLLEDYDIHYHSRKHSLCSPINKGSKFSFPPSPTVIFKPDSPDCHLNHHGIMGSPTPGRRASLSAITSGSGLRSSFGLQVPTDLRWNIPNVQEQQDEGIGLEGCDSVNMKHMKQRRDSYTEFPLSVPAKQQPPATDYLAFPIILPDAMHEASCRKSLSPRSSSRGSPISDISTTMVDEKCLLRVPSGSSLTEIPGLNIDGDQIGGSQSPVPYVQQKGQSNKRLRKRECGRHSPRQKASRSKNNSPTILSPLPCHRAEKVPHPRRNSPKFFFPRQSSSTDSASSTTDETHLKEMRHSSHVFRKASSVSSFPECSRKPSPSIGAPCKLSSSHRSVSYRDPSEYDAPIDLTMPTAQARLTVPSTTSVPFKSCKSIPQQSSQKRFLPRYKTVYHTDSVESSIQTESDDQEQTEKGRATTRKWYTSKDVDETTTTEPHEEDEFSESAISDDSGHTETTSLLANPNQPSIQIQPRASSSSS